MVFPPASRFCGKVDKDGILLARTHWGAVLLGAVSGLFVMVVAGLLLLLVVQLIGVDVSDTGQFGVLAFALFLGQFLAGYVGGRLTSADQPGFHGSMAGMALYAIVSILSLAAGSSAGALSLITFGIVASVIGYAGGTLADKTRE